MERKDVLIFAALCAGFAIGFGVAWATKPVPDPTIEVGPGFTLKVNGKPVDLSKLKFQIPAQPDRKKNDGALGEPPPVAKPAAQVIEQRGQPNKPVEAFGIETLVQVLKELKEAFFGNPKLGTPGLRDDIAKGLGDFYSTLRTGFIVFVGSTLGLFGWIALSLHRIAEKTGKAV